MGVASLVLGIISFVTGWIPFICLVSFILAVSGLILGIVDTIKKNKTGDNKKGISIAGLVLSAISIPIIIFSMFVTLGVFITMVTNDGSIVKYNDRYNNSYYDDDWYDNDDDDWYENWYRNVLKNNIKYNDTI